jgi:hypothetical protein
MQHREERLAVLAGAEGHSQEAAAAQLHAHGRVTAVGDAAGAVLVQSVHGVGGAAAAEVCQHANAYLFVRAEVRGRTVVAAEVVS